jgi:hypothetical protein
MRLSHDRLFLHKISSGNVKIECYFNQFYVFFECYYVLKMTKPRKKLNQIDLMCDLGIWFCELYHFCV